MTSNEGIDLKMVSLVGAFGVLGTTIIICFISVVYFQKKNEITQSKAFIVPTTELDELTEVQQAKLTSYKLLDAEKEKYSIPVELAMQLVVKDIAEGRDLNATINRSAASETTGKVAKEPVDDAADKVKSDSNPASPPAKSPEKPAKESLDTPAKEPQKKTSKEPRGIGTSDLSEDAKS